MLYNFVIDVIGGPLADVYGFVPLIVSGILLFVFSAVVLNFLFNTINHFFFKS